MTPQRGEKAAAAILHYSPALYLMKTRPASLNDVFSFPLPAARGGFGAFCRDGRGGAACALR